MSRTERKLLIIIGEILLFVLKTYLYDRSPVKSKQVADSIFALRVVLDEATGGEQT